MENHSWMDSHFTLDQHILEGAGALSDDLRLPPLQHSMRNDMNQQDHQQVPPTYDMFKATADSSDFNLPPPPSYEQAIQSDTRCNSGRLGQQPGPSLDFYMSSAQASTNENTRHYSNLLIEAWSAEYSASQFFGERNTHVAAAEPQSIEDVEAEMVCFSMEETTGYAFGPDQLPSAITPYPYRPESASREVPCPSNLGASLSGSEYSFYNLDSGSSINYQEPSTPSTSSLTPRPQSTASNLSELEEYIDINNIYNISQPGMAVEQVPGNSSVTAETLVKDMIDEKQDMGPHKMDAEVQAFPQEVAGEGTSLAERAEKLLKDVRDEQVLACARRMAETNDPGLLTKMMLKTKVELDLFNKGKALPDITDFPSKPERHQLRPEEKEKEARRKHNGRVSAKTYRDKQKLLKSKKEVELKELEERNVYLKKQKAWLEETLSTVKHMLEKRASSTVGPDIPFSFPP